MRAALLIGLLFSSGCVSKAQYAELESQYTALEAENQSLQKKNDNLEKRLQKSQALLDAQRAARKQLREELGPLVEAGVLEIEESEGRVSLKVSADILFASGSAELSEEGKGHVEKIAKILAKRTELAYQVEGHTDNAPIATEAYPDNWHLGAARAITVTQVMIAAGMPADRVSAASYGDTLPTAPNKTPKGQAKNRRIEIVVQPDLGLLKGPEGKPGDGKGGKGGKGPKGGKGKPPKGAKAKEPAPAAE